MATRIDDNADQFLKSYDDLAPKRTRHVLAIENIMSYAIYVHAKLGWYVIDEETAARIIADVLTPIVNSDKPLSDDDLEWLLEKAADMIVDEYQRFGGFSKSPVESGRGMRPAHVGSWADITTELASNYYTRVNRRQLKQHEYNEPPQVSDPSKYPRIKLPITI